MKHTMNEAYYEFEHSAIKRFIRSRFFHKKSDHTGWEPATDGHTANSCVQWIEIDPTRYGDRIVDRFDSCKNVAIDLPNIQARQIKLR